MLTDLVSILNSISSKEYADALTDIDILLPGVHGYIDYLTTNAKWRSANSSNDIIDSINYLNRISDSKNGNWNNFSATLKKWLLIN